jgi:N-acyl-D-aspartate/D-glutamate deacylase
MEKAELLQLREKMSRPPTEEEWAKIKKNLEFSVETGKVTISEGFEFIQYLRREARRQQAAQAAEQLEIQARAVQDLPYVPSNAKELELAESFEIIEED